MRSIHVLRKPCSEPTVAANVLRHGTGAVNVDTCRTSGVGQANGNGGGSGAGQYDERGSGRVRTGINPYSGTLGGKVVDPHPVGRWPANLILQHLDGCVQDGIKKVKVIGATAHRKEHRSHSWVAVGTQPHEHAGFRDHDGTETVTAWVCAHGCPVAALDQQSGECRSAGVYPSSSTGTGTSVTYGKSLPQGALYSDIGGASRFFKQVKP